MTKWRREQPTLEECLQYPYWWFRGRVTAEWAGYGQQRGEALEAQVAAVYWMDGVVTLSAGDWSMKSDEFEGEWAPCTPPEEP
jgi:hypothetical protein